MKIGEHLYLAGYITYPRSETTSYPKKFDFNSIIETIAQMNNPTLSNYAHKLKKVNQILFIF